VPKALIDEQVRSMQIDTGAPHWRERCVAGSSAEPFVEPARRRVALGMLVNEL